MMPGSRHSEIKYHMPILVPTSSKPPSSTPSSRFHIPCAHTLKSEELWAFSRRRTAKGQGRITIHEGGQSHDVLELCHAALIASGTSILQGVMSNRPLASFYRLDGLTFWIGKKLIDLPHVGLSNLIAKREIHRELLQDDMNEENLMAEMESLMWDDQRRQTMLDDFKFVQDELGAPGASERAATVVLENMI